MKLLKIKIVCAITVFCGLLLSGCDKNGRSSGSLDLFESENGGVSGENKDLDQLTFKNTQKWGANHLEAIGKGPNYLKNWQQEIEIPPPPANSSPRTAKELDYMVELKNQRSEVKQAEITAELESEGLSFGGDIILGDLPENSPKLHELIYTTFHEADPIIGALKMRFNRVRPSFLNPDIEPTIDLPEHAAYPSGHSTISHLYSLVLGDVYSGRLEEFQESARSISKNREVAGVHYVSDSEAGRILAAQIYRLWSVHPRYRKLLAAARAEAASVKK